jgi:hypothetical protein
LICGLTGPGEPVGTREQMPGSGLVDQSARENGRKGGKPSGRLGTSSGMQMQDDVERLIGLPFIWEK